jgi:hypothetical protein
VLLKWAQQDAMHISSSRPLSQTHITMQEGAIEGVQVVADSDARGAGAYDGTFWVRVFVEGNRTYTVSSYVFDENWGNRRAWVMPFLESFRIWKQ